MKRSVEEKLLEEYMVGINRWSRVVGLLGLSTCWACGSTNNTYFNQYFVKDPDAGAPTAPPSEDDPDPDAGLAAGDGHGVTPLGGGLGGDAGAPLVPGWMPRPDVAASALQLDVFGTVGNHYWFDAPAEQVELMNAPYVGIGNYGDIYAPVGGDDAPTFVDHLYVTSAGDAPHTADFGKVQVRLVGQSTGRPWTETTLPNFKIDADEFIDGNRIGGVKHMRLNNAVYGTIYRERLVFDIYRALGYPAPRATYAWVSGSVWGPDIDVPYVAVESYKPQFCKLREAELGGGCVNMWEFYGDFGQGLLDVPENCQFSECDSTRVLELEDAVLAAPLGEGFKAALEDWIDWDAFHRFQCLSWILVTGDDYIHNLNNVVLVERADGKFQFLPYSVDLSLDPGWFGYGLGGVSTLANGCQNDPTCWADLILTCEGVIDAFTRADPVAMLDSIQEELETAGMLRGGDGGRYSVLRSYIEQRIHDLPGELDLNRDGPAVTYCDYPYVLCGDACVFPEECGVCEEPPEGDPADDEPVESSPDAGASDAGTEPVESVPPDEGGACVPAYPVY